MTTVAVADLGSPPYSDLDPYADDFLADPFPALAALRAGGPVVYLRRYDVWAASRYTDVHAVLRDPAQFTSTAGVGLANLHDDAYGWRPPSLLLETQPPQHTVNRSAVVSAMTPRALGTFQDLFDAAADDLVARLVAAVHDAAGRAGLSDQDSAGLVRSLFSAGVDTTVSGLAFAIRNLARDPEQWDLLRADPTLARNAFEETIRVESPVIGFYRTTTTDVRIGEVTVPADAKVLVLYAGANRDPSQFPDPDRFDIRRKVAGHVGYGVGPHVCAGMAIARMEGESVLRALTDHVRSWRVTGQPRARLNNSLRSLASLPVHVEPARP